MYRLERLQRIVSKVQMESGLCEEQLNQVETVLQSVRLKAIFIPLLESKDPIPFEQVNLHYL